MGSVQLDDLKPFCDHCVFQEMERITSPTAQAVSSQAPLCTWETREHGKISQVELNCTLPLHADGFVHLLLHQSLLKEVVTLQYFITPPEEMEPAHLPSMVRARGVGLVQPGGSIKVKSHDQSRDSKRPATVALSVPLLRRNRHAFHKQLRVRAESRHLYVTTRKGIRNIFRRLSHPATYWRQDSMSYQRP